MPEKIIPTSKQKSTFMLHVLVFIIANAALWAYWYFGQGAKDHWVYPWGIWITAAWGLSLIGHWAAVYTSFEDAGNADFIKQRDN
jgi:fatty acid desaturase